MPDLPIDIIPSEAMEAVAKTLASQFEISWENIGKYAQLVWRQRAHDILTVAIPHLRNQWADRIKLERGYAIDAQLPAYALGLERAEKLLRQEIVQ